MHQLEADNIMLKFGSRTLLSDIYIKCETGKVTGLLGRNGHGKSTLMNIIFGSLQPALKSIRFDGKPIDCAFKVPGLIAYLTQFNFIPRGSKLSKIFDDFEVSYTDFEKLFPEFSMLFQHQVASLSGGQQRLVSSYVLLASKAKFVLLDEPFTHLSPVMTEKLKELIKSTLTNKGILLTDHLFREVIDLSTDVYLLSEGKLKLVKEPELGQLYSYAPRM